MQGGMARKEQPMMHPGVESILSNPRCGTQHSVSPSTTSMHAKRARPRHCLCSRWSQSRIEV
eukprot:3153305-Amphidinium_carterae.1